MRCLWCSTQFCVSAAGQSLSPGEKHDFKTEKEQTEEETQTQTIWCQQKQHKRLVSRFIMTPRTVQNLSVSLKLAMETAPPG